MSVSTSAPNSYVGWVAALLEVTSRQLERAPFPQWGLGMLYALQVHDLALCAADEVGLDLADAAEIAAQIPGGFPRDNWQDNWSQAKRMIEAPRFDEAPENVLALIPEVVRVDAGLTC